MERTQAPEQLRFNWVEQRSALRRVPAPTSQRRRLILLEVDEADIWMYRMLWRMRRGGTGLSLWLEA